MGGSNVPSPFPSSTKNPSQVMLSPLTGTIRSNFPTPLRSAAASVCEPCVAIATGGCNVPSPFRYLAGRAAAGQVGQINEYAIGVDVFDRPESFDPKTDAVVRAEVRRLRQNLTDYGFRRGPADHMRAVGRTTPTPGRSAEKSTFPIMPEYPRFESKMMALFNRDCHDR